MSANSVQNNEENSQMEREEGSGPNHDSIKGGTESNSGEIKMEKECQCGMTNTLTPSFVYAVGRITYDYQNDSVREEVRNAINAAVEEEVIPKGLGEGKALYQLLTGPRKNVYRYLSRHLCWFFSAGCLENYVLVPSDPLDYDLFIEVLNFGFRNCALPLSDPKANEIINLIVGEKGPITPCGVFALPMVRVDRLLTLKVQDDLINQLTRAAKKQYDPSWKDAPYKVNADAYIRMVSVIFEKLMQAADNEGSEPTHRALNYLALNSLYIYTESARRQVEEGWVLEDIIPKPPTTIGSNQIVCVVFYYRSGLGTEMWAYDVNVTYKFPFLASGFKRYYNA